MAEAVANRTANSRTLGFLACAGAGALWGTGFFFGKLALREVSVGHMVLYRFLFALAAVSPMLIRRLPRFSRRDWYVLLGSAFAGIPLQFLVQFKGLSLTSVAHASLMVGTMPVILAGAAALFLHERMDRTGWIALGASTLGACLIALSSSLHKGPRPGDTSSLQGDALVVISLIIALAWILGNKDLLDRHNTGVVTTYGLLCGTLMLAVWVPLQYGMPPVRGLHTTTWVALAASGVLCTATTTMLWNWGMTQVPASQAGVFLNMEPVMGSTLGVLVFREQLGPSAWVGGLLILLSAILITTRSRTGTQSTALAIPE